MILVKMDYKSSVLQQRDESIKTIQISCLSDIARHIPDSFTTCVVKSPTDTVLPHCLDLETLYLSLKDNVSGLFDYKINIGAFSDMMMSHVRETKVNIELDEESEDEYDEILYT